MIDCKTASNQGSQQILSTRIMLRKLLKYLNYQVVWISIKEQLQQSYRIHISHEYLKYYNQSKLSNHQCLSKIKSINFQKKCKIIPINLIINISNMQEQEKNSHRVILKRFLAQQLQFTFATKEQLQEIMKKLSQENQQQATAVYLEFQNKKIPLKKVLKNYDKYLPSEEDIQLYEKIITIPFVKLYKDRRDEVKICIEKIQVCKEKLDKIYEKIQDIPSKQIFARKLAIMSEQQSTECKINVQICMLISDPLARKQIKNQKQAFQPIIKQEQNIAAKHQSIIYNSFRQNSMVAVNIQKHYATRSMIRKVLEEKSEQIYTFKVVQIFADAIKDKNGKVYLKLQSHTNIGSQQKCLLEQFLFQNTKADIVFFIGKGYHQITQNIKLKTKTVVIAIDTYSIDYDQCLNYFIQYFYSCLFRTAKPHDCFNYAMEGLKSEKKKDSIAFKKYANFCCCLHEHEPECCWSDLAQILGQTLVHKIFLHSEILKNSSSQRKANNDLLNHIKVLLQIKKKNCCTLDNICCCSDSHFSYQNKFINLVQDYLEQQIQKQPKRFTALNHTFTGIAKQEIPKRNRHKNIFKLVMKMLKFKNILVLQGPRMSGKNELLSLASRYILQRKNDTIIIQSISYQLQGQANCLKQIQYIRKKHANTNKKIFICLLKPIQNINNIIQLLDEKKRNQSNIWNNFHFIVFNRKDNIIRKPNMQICLIEQLTLDQILYIILREFTPERLITILQFFMSEMERQIDIFESEKALKFIKFVEMLAGKKQIENAKNQQIPHILKKQLLNYHSQQTNTIIEIKKKQIRLWIFLFILSAFRQGLHVTHLTKIFFDQILQNTITDFMKNFTTEESKQIQKWQKQVFQQIKANLQNRELVGLIVNKREIVNKKQFYVSEILTHQKEITEGNYEQETLQNYISTITPEESLIIYFKKLSTQHSNGEFQFKCQFLFFDMLFQAAKRYIMTQNNFYFKRHSRYWENGIFMYVLESQVIKILQGCNASKNVSKEIVLHYQHLLIFLDRLKKYKISEMAIEKRLKIIKFLVNISIVSKVLLKGRYFQRIQSIFIQVLKQYRPEILEQHIAKLQLKVILQDFSRQQIINLQAQDKQIFINLKNFEETLLNFQVNQNAHEKQQGNRPQFDEKNHYQSQTNRLKKCLMHLDNCIKILKQSKAKESREKYEKCLLLKLKIYSLAVLAIFQYVSNPKVTTVPHNNIEQGIIDLLQKLFQQNLKLEEHPQLQSDIKICLGFFNYIKKTQVDSLWTNINNHSPQFQKVINFVLEQGNFLINQPNLLLFMKARCYYRKNQSFIFTRKSYPLREYLMKNLSNHDANLCFFSLTRKNFNLLKKVHSFILVITTDAYAQRNQPYKLLFEDSNGIQQDLIDTEKFLTSIKHIKLILLCGLNVSKFVQQIPKSQDIPWVICIDNDLDLANSNIVKYDKVLKIQNGPILFERKQTYFNFIDLFICRLFGLIVEKGGASYTTQGLEAQIQNSMNIIERVMIAQWPMVSAIKKCLFLQIFPCCIEGQDHVAITFPIFRQGNPHDVTMKVKQIPNNLHSNHNSPYHIVGRHNEIHQTIRYFEEKQKGVVQIRGSVGSGKSCLLQQICWILILKKKCQQGVYRFRMRNIKDCSLMDHISIKYEYQYLLECIQSQKKRLFPLLIALDDLQYKDLQENADFFQKIFNSPNKIYIIYTTSDNRIYDTMKVKFPSINFQKISTNKLSDLERYNIILSNLNSFKISLPKQSQIVQTLMSKQLESASEFLSQIKNKKFLDKAVQIRQIKRQHEKVLSLLRDKLNVDQQHIIRIVQ